MISVLVYCTLQPTKIKVEKELILLRSTATSTGVQYICCISVQYTGGCIMLRVGMFSIKLDTVYRLVTGVALLINKPLTSP